MRVLVLTTSICLFSLLCRGQSTAIVTSLDKDPVTGKVIVKNLTPAQLSAMLGSPTLFVYDCNEEDMYKEAHVPGAKLTVYDEVTADKLPPDRNATLVFYCYSPECPAAGSAARSAIALGYTDVHCMVEGITGWQDAGLATEPK